MPYMYNKHVPSILVTKDDPQQILRFDDLELRSFLILLALS